MVLAWWTKKSVQNEDIGGKYLQCSYINDASFIIKNVSSEPNTTLIPTSKNKYQIMMKII